jgi:hypothetical protein
MPATTRGRLSAERIRELALAGAAAALNKLRSEVVALERTFPELATKTGRRAVSSAARRRTRSMSAAARKAVSARMKKYWAERRKVRAK